MTTLTRPVAGGSISNTFAQHVARKSVNPGVDFAVAKGTAVVAPASGVVKKVRTTVSGSGAAGRFVIIYHDNGGSSDLIHLSRVDVKVGDRVSQGEQVGLSGASANGSENGVGPHLHWTYRPENQVLSLSNVGNVDGLKYVATAPVNPWADKKAVQTRLNVWRRHWGLPLLAVDGVIGKQTKAAIVDAQKRFGIAADGVVGPTTWGRLAAEPPKPAPVEPPKPVEPAPVEPPKPVEPAPVEPPKPVEPAPVEPPKPVEPAPLPEFPEPTPVEPPKPVEPAPLPEFPEPTPVGPGQPEPPLQHVKPGARNPLVLVALAVITTIVTALVTLLT